MSDPGPVRTAWVQPVLLAVATAAALGLGFLYFSRPNAGELGAIRVVVADEDGKSGGAIRVIVAEAPLVQKETVSPGPAYTDVVHYPVPYLTLPHLKLTGGKRQYDIVTQTQLGFTWVARLAADDLREGAPKEGNLLENLLGNPAALAALKGNLKPGILFEEFTWEAKGLRAPLYAVPFAQSGTFYAMPGAEGQENYPIPYESPPNVELSPGSTYTTVVECTAQGFTWRNRGGGGTEVGGQVTWTAKGVLGGGGK
jgi:hypothetical protein